MFKRMSITLVFVLLISSVLTACDGGAPVTFKDLPVFPGATASANEMLKGAMAKQIEIAKSDSKIKNIEGTVYDLPANITGEAAIAFYKDALGKTGWTMTQSDGNVLSFNRGKQAFTINYYATFPAIIVTLTEAQ